MGLFSSRKKLARSSPVQHKSAENWELDAEFFAALSQWTLDHPDSTLDHVLQRINEAIDNGKDYVDLIPDTPFPARGLVQSVAQVIQLSTKISRAQKEVRDFAPEVIHWIDRVRESFTEAGNGRFTSITWDNLADIRSLIDMICNWATERLKDGRWSISNREIKDEIANFRDSLDDACKAFNDRSLIVISGGLDAIFQSLSTLSSHPHTLSITLKNLQRTQDEHSRRILKEQERRNFLEEELGPRTIDDLSYVMQDMNSCYPGTRREILEEIKAWINEHSKETSKNFLWLVGPPGCGKSTIAASIVEYCQSRDILGSQFFIDRNNHNTTDPRVYFPTVVRDLYKRSESVEQHLHDALKGRKFSLDMPERATEVFLDTIGKATRDSPDHQPIVIIFDGLDETRRDHLESTAVIFSRLFTRLRDYPNAKILISSRPEGEILRSFWDTTSSSKHVEVLPIDINDENSRRDIKDYLKHHLTEIAKKHRLASAIWPGDERLERLVERASGLFTWAVTACRYIDSQLDLEGTEVLNTVLDQFDNPAMMDINTLYLTILEESYPQGYNDERTLETFRRLVGAILVVREPMNIRDLNALLELWRDPHSLHVDIRNVVRRLRILLVADLDDVTDDTIPQAHKLFFDFITSSHSPDHFRVDIDVSNAEMALLCLRHISNAYSDVHNTHYASQESNLKVLSAAARYSLRFALSHMPKLQGTTLGVLSDQPRIMEASKLDVLLRHLSHLNHAGPLSFSVPSNHAFVRTSFEKHSLIWNTEDGSATKGILSMGLQNSSQVFFSPGGTHIFIWDFQGLKWGLVDSYDLTMSSLVTTAPPQGSVFFKPCFDGTKFVFVTDQNLETILLYSTSPDSVASEIPNRHHTKIKSLCMSQNCSYIASSPEKHSVIDIWDVGIEYYINRSDSMQHKYPVECMAFSPDLTMLISCDRQCAYVWEIPMCTRKHHTFILHPGGPDSVAFSPDSQIVLAGSKEGTISLWNPHSGEQIGEPWKVPTEGDNKWVYNVAFRSCGNIALACCGGSVYVWNIHYATLLIVIPNITWPRNAVFTPDGSQLLYVPQEPGLGIYNLAPLLLNSKNTFKPKWTTFSPGGNLVVSVATDEILCWRLDAVKVVGNPLKGSVTSIDAIAFSLDESRIVGAAEDGTTYLWDSTTQELLSSLPDYVHGASSLLFSPDGAHIVAKLADDQSVVLSVVNDILAVSSADEATYALQKVAAAPKSTFFDLNKPPVTFGTDPAAPNRRLKDVRWYPSRSDSLVWAYVNNHIVRAGKDGSFVVVPVGNPSSG